MSSSDTPHAETTPDRSGPVYELDQVDDRSGARLGRLRTLHGIVHTPAFMPVGTQATVKALSPDEVAATGTEILLANTYHLMLRPGVGIIQMAGGLHRFMNWHGPILTDSGGFQVFSLAHRRIVREEGVEFRSHLDGSLWQLTPESAVDLQAAFGSDVMMPLDVLVGFSDDDAAQHDAMERTHRWLVRAVAHFERRFPRDDSGRPLLFGIAQGGFDGARRQESARFVAEQVVDGSAIGGLSVGEPKSVMLDMLSESISQLPSSRPRYLMGVGSPEDLWHGVSLGVDMFDCVHPTRVARRGALFTPDGRVNVGNQRFKQQFGPVDETCDCATCRTYSAAYLHHLFRSRELLAYRLGSIHNVRFMQRQVETMRRAIADGSFVQAKRRFLDRYRIANEEQAARQRTLWKARRTPTD